MDSHPIFETSLSRTAPSVSISTIQPAPPLRGQRTRQRYQLLPLLLILRQRLAQAPCIERLPLRLALLVPIADQPCRLGG